jgi:hypothetical protein
MSDAAVVRVVRGAMPSRRHARQCAPIADDVKLGESGMRRQTTVPLGFGMFLLVLTGTVDGQTLGAPQQVPSQTQPMDWLQKKPVEDSPGGCAPLAPIPPCGDSGFFAWAGVYCLQPVTLDNKFTALTINTQNSQGSVLSSTGVNFDYTFNAAPQVVLGYNIHDGLAFQTRYWHFDESTHSNVTSPAASSDGTIFLSPGGPFNAPFVSVPSGNTLFTSDRLEVDVLDLELTQEVNVGRCSLVYTAGLRLARVRQSYSASANVTETDPESESLNAADTTEGIGPTISYEFRRPLGYGLSLYHSSRVAVLFGHESLDGAAVGTGLGFDGDSIQVSSSRMEFIPMGELEVGLEWSANIANWHLTAQATGVGMVYGSLGFGGFNVRFGVEY